MARLDVALGGGGLSPTEIVDCVRLTEELNYESVWHEGSWPHSAESIKRPMGYLSETSRAKVLGLSAAQVFKLMKFDSQVR